MTATPLKLKKILVIGPGPEASGQGRQLNGAVWQVCQVLRSEAIKVILIDSNLSTVATDRQVAARTYIEPLTVTSLEQIIGKEKPDAILPICCGRSLLGLLTELTGRNVLAKYHLKVLGVDPAQLAASDRLPEIREILAGEGFEANPGAVVRNDKEGFDLILKLGFPVALRPLGSSAGVGLTIVYNREEFGAALGRALDFSPVRQVLIETSLAGWGEYELVTLRDSSGAGLTVAAVEYLEPAGAPPGDRLKIIPAWSLTAPDYQLLTDGCFQVMRYLKLVGGACLRFARNPVTGAWVLTNINPRYTTVSALTALVAGCPLIESWIKLVLGYPLTALFSPETLNSGTVLTPEGEGGYVGVAAPHYPGERRPEDQRMVELARESVGEVLGLGSCFKEALQKAARSLEAEDGGESGSAVGQPEPQSQAKLVNPGSRLLFDLRRVFKDGLNTVEAGQLSLVRPWIREELAELARLERELTTYALYNLPARLLRQAKAWGFSDRRLAEIFRVSVAQLRDLRKRAGVIPKYRAIPASVPGRRPPVVFSTYNAADSEIDAHTCAADVKQEKKESPITNSQQPTANFSEAAAPRVFLVGSGPLRVGAGLEADYCLVHAANAVAERGDRCLLVDSNPHSAALDSPCIGQVYLEPLRGEELLNLTESSGCTGVLWEYSGPSGARARQELVAAGARLYGAMDEVAALVRDPDRFGSLLAQVGLDLAEPGQVAPGTVGLAAEIIGDGVGAVVTGIVEQIEEARINLDDSACSLPPYSVDQTILDWLGAALAQLGRILKLRGLLTVRLAVCRNRTTVLEAWLGASQLTPLICKSTGIFWVELATHALLGKSLEGSIPIRPAKLNFTVVKEAVFPSNRFSEGAPVLGAASRSCGAALGMALDFGMAFIKAQLAVGERLPGSGVVYLSISGDAQQFLTPIAKQLIELGFELLAPKATALILQDCGLRCQAVNQIGLGRPDVLDWVKNCQVHWVIQTTAPDRDYPEAALARRTALAHGIPITTTLAGTLATVQGLRQYLAAGPIVKALQDYTYFAAPFRPEA
jgi:carbamoyl-phosphate synthase large subunit